MPNEPMKPSDFVNAGVPSCSIFHETMHEITALTVVRAMALSGDKWKRMTPGGVMKVYEENPDQEWPVGVRSVLYAEERLERVLAVLASEKQAREFSSSWARVR